MKKRYVIGGVITAGAFALGASSCGAQSDPRPAPSVVTESSIPDAGTPATSKPAAPVTPSGLSDGTYLAGTDIKAGTYKTPGPGSTDIMDSCYWSVNRDDLGEDIVANNNITGPARITVKTGQYLELNGGCNWSRVVIN